MLKRHCHFLVIATLFMSSSAFAQAPRHADGYQLPPAALQAIVDAPRAPTVNLSPRRNLAAMVKTPSLPSIAEVAQPEMKLAGLRINPRTYSASRFSFGQDLWLLDVETRMEMRISGLPAAMKLADLQWSPDQRYLAFTHLALSSADSKTAGAEVQLWLVNVAAKSAKKLSATPLNTVYGRGFTWMPDSQSLLVRMRPLPLAVAPAAVMVPSGPNMQETDAGGEQRQIRTYQDLLKNPQDAALFDHYTLTQLVLLSVSGKSSNIGVPARFSLASPSPDGKLILTRSIERPYSYVVPANGFAHKFEVRDLRGKVVHTVASMPLVEGMPVGRDRKSVV